MNVVITSIELPKRAEPSPGLIELATIKVVDDESIDDHDGSVDVSGANPFWIQGPGTGHHFCPRLLDGACNGPALCLGHLLGDTGHRRGLIPPA